jgi:hypothetical protein
MAAMCELAGRMFFRAAYCVDWTAEKRLADIEVYSMRVTHQTSEGYMFDED